MFSNSISSKIQLTNYFEKQRNVPSRDRSKDWQDRPPLGLGSHFNIFTISKLLWTNESMTEIDAQARVLSQILVISCRFYVFSIDFSCVFMIFCGFQKRWRRRLCLRPRTNTKKTWNAPRTSFRKFKIWNLEQLFDTKNALRQQKSRFETDIFVNFYHFSIYYIFDILRFKNRV